MVITQIEALAPGGSKPPPTQPLVGDTTHTELARTVGTPTLEDTRPHYHTTRTCGIVRGSLELGAPYDAFNLEADVVDAGTTLQRTPSSTMHSADVLRHWQLDA